MAKVLELVYLFQVAPIIARVVSMRLLGILIMANLIHKK